MPFDEQERAAMLRERAEIYSRVALANVTREYPVMPYFVATGPAPYPTHREMHPAFYGCFDWHSCVEMVWVVVRLLRQLPNEVPGNQARTTLDELLTDEHIAVELRTFQDPTLRSFERPYGWGWLLTLAHELETWDDPDGGHWASTLRPLADLLAERFVAWLPLLTYPQRSGLHPNTACALSRALDFARLRAEQGNDALLRAIEAAATRFFQHDAAYPANYEPSDADFLSPALSEAELMSRLLPAAGFPAWLERFLPGLAAAEPASIFHPATVSDITDGQIAHLHGLNLSRAWACVALAARLPSRDPRIPALQDAAARHAAASLPVVAGSDYNAEHWLAAYATLLLTE
jgi:hypothetical protein